MDKKELQKRAGIINEDYSLHSRGVTAFCVKDGLNWEMDGVPPAPSDIERAQARSGHIESEIADIKRLAGIREDGDITECPGSDGSLDTGMEKIRSVMGALKQGHVSNEQMFLRLQAALEDFQSSADESNNIHAGDGM